MRPYKNLLCSRHELRLRWKGRLECSAPTMAGSFVEHYSNHGVQRHLTTPYTLEQNGVTERNQSIMGMAHSMLEAMSIPRWFWGVAVTTAVFILNQSPPRH
jgi:hypothetical protein